MDAKISVIIPAYNAANTVSETLGSVARQTRQPFEVIVVDDGSVDTTADVARGFADRLPRLQIISTPNGGVSRARNAAIAVATGDIIAPLDADDLWHPTYLERLCGRLERLGPNAAFVYCSWWAIDTEGVVVGANEVVMVEGIAFYRLLAHNYVGNGSNTVMWRHRLEALGGYDERLAGSEDYNLQARLAWAGPVSSVPERLVGYRNTPKSLSKQYRLMALQGIGMLGRLRRQLPADRRAMDWAMSSAHLQFYLVVRMFGAGTRLEALWHLLISAVYDPVRIGYRMYELLEIRLYRRLQKLRGRPAGAPPPPLRGAHFYDIDPVAEWPSRLARLTHRRVRRSEALDRARALEIGLDPPPPTVLEFQLPPAQESAGPLAVARQ